eukprot:gene20742-40624_t
MVQMILALKAQGVSILLSEQNMHFAELVSDRAYVLEKGQIRYQASMQELAANEEHALAMTEAFVQVNQVRHALTETTRRATLLQVLRNDLQLNGPKYGCGLGECGACTVWVDGVAARACVIPAHGVSGRSITTLEGLPALHAQGGELHPVQQ